MALIIPKNRVGFANLCILADPFSYIARGFIACDNKTPGSSGDHDIDDALSLHALRWYMPEPE